MKIIKELTVAKPVSEVWEILANQFGEIDMWASIISKSVVSGPGKIAGLDYSVRTTTTAKGDGQQEITGFAPSSHTISYKSLSGTPAVIKGVKAKWVLTKKDENSTALRLDFEAEMKGMGHLLSPIVKMKLGKVGDVLLDDFKFYVENGKPSARKINSMR